jgi:transcriptional regulator with XRE-family HTH domain
MFYILHLFQNFIKQKISFFKTFFADILNMNEENFWDRVKTLLKQNKLTQENLAEKAGLNFNNLKQQIFYNRIPDAVQSVAIAQVLNTSVEFLVTGEESDSSKNQLLEIKKQLEQMLASLR